MSKIFYGKSLFFKVALSVVLMLFSVSNIAQGANLAESSIDNGVLKVGINNSEYGGAITYLSVSGEDRNLINNHDRGRQVQQSYYAGQSIDRRAEGQSPHWSPWSWNPIQVGDTFMNSSAVLEHTNDGNEIYVKTHPLLWDMNNEFAECHFETWIQLKDNRVLVRNRLTKFRTDNRWNITANHQELPAVYTIADLPHLYTYEGEAPFTNAPLKKIVNNGPPWAYWGQGVPTEKWAAYVDDNNWGVGVYYEDTELFVGGFHGSPGGGTMAGSTGYISPLRTITLQKDMVFDYEYELIVGTLDEIRHHVYVLEGHIEEEPEPEIHSADTNANLQIEQDELLRVIQLYNAGAYHCVAESNASEDGYSPGSGINYECTPHHSDYNPQNWHIGLSELIRLIQLHNADTYHYCGLETEDTFCLGAVM